MSAPLTTTDGLKVGDVVTVATKLRDPRTGQPYWWTRFAAVIQIDSDQYLTALTLKLKPNLDRDERVVWLKEDIVIKLDPDKWPEGVSAMYMKLVTQGIIKIG